VEGSCRDDNRISGMDPMFFIRIEHEPGRALLDAEELIDVWMDFIADFFAWLKAHHDQLAMFTGENYFSKEGVLLGQLFDGANKRFHFFIPFCHLL
jgi:hypothetical protein